MNTRVETEYMPSAPRRADSLARQLKEWLLRWGRSWLLLGSVLLVGGLLGAYATARMYAGHVVGGPDLQTFTTAKELSDRLKQQAADWPPVEESVLPGRNSLAEKAASPAQKDPGQVRTVELFYFRVVQSFDSFGIVLGYVMLFLCEYLVLSLCFPREPSVDRQGNGLSGWELGLHGLCFMPVAAGVFDLAENAVTLVAAEDAVSYVLADETVRDMHALSVWKWSMLGMSCISLSGLALWGQREVKRQDIALTNWEYWLLPIAALVGVVTACAFWAFPWQPKATFFGSLGLVAALACAGWICGRVLRLKKPTGLAASSAARS